MNVRIETLKYAEVALLSEAGHANARYMRHETLKRLTTNVKRDGVLTQIPFCFRNVREADGSVTLAVPDGRWLVLSGNHRVIAARDAGLVEGPFLVTDDALTWDEAKAIQLSHNAIAGEDDPGILKQLYESIAAIDLKAYAGLDDKTLELLQLVGTEPAPKASLLWTNITLTFLPDEVEELKKVIALATDLAKGEVFAVRIKDYEPFIEAIAAAGAAHNVKNTATALGLVLEVFQRHLTDLETGWVAESEAEVKLKHKGWVPIASLFGTTTIPAEVALVLQKALRHAIDQGDVKGESRWRLLELLAADYLAG